MDLRALRKRCDAIVRQLNIPTPFDARDFCDMVATQRGRPIVLRPTPMGRAIYGVWLATASTDIILYERETSPVHQRHIIVHELAHILCDHQPTRVAPEEAPALPSTELDPERIQTTMYRAMYSAAEEQEAELLASLILRRTVGVAPRHTSPPAAGSARLLQRLAVSLEEWPPGQA